jgi:23S rRNA (adenine2503-C2)-methyltransferase
MDDILNALDLSYDELTEICTTQWGLPRYRADQISQWIYAKKVFDFSEMTNLSKELRKEMANRMMVLPPYEIKRQVSEKDGTTKYLWGMNDGETIESVVLFHGNHTTACISTQAGCPLRCLFCATGKTGFARNLTISEITGQFLSMEKNIGRDINNIVFMGMGEPLLNLENVKKSIRILNHPKMRNLGIRHFTVSTAGIVPGIRDLADSELPVRLSVSLHAPNDDIRNRIMPVNREYPLNRLMEALEYYQDVTGERITIEYILLKNINDQPEHAYELVSLLGNLRTYINLIPYNPVDSGFERSPVKQVKEFYSILSSLGCEVETRTEKGTDIDAACGQLRRKK